LAFFASDFLLSPEPFDSEVFASLFDSPDELLDSLAFLSASAPF